MSAKNPALRLKEIDDQRTELDRERAEIEEGLKAEALRDAEVAIQKLVDLGYNYRLAGSGKRSLDGRKPARGPSRVGIRAQILDVVRRAGQKGIKVAEVRGALGIAENDVSGSQAVANSLFALKRVGRITTEKGTYRVKRSAVT